ncbi:hypothetical protein HYPSUDRAFT_200700 [Hypholoma sublateritium FD-334 SS-4]|uniref:Uncharacterized protein n=1 Tax=Hypholoma sublateritium (strain FD-334 SS-4) TaxID=945553 RepID=A0A0D2PXR9_HYPSF|nr:hypothetical protein HYPSUDRAFT_200700 [Hypholoma sublateritium FD-334 SS-4]
MHLHPAPNRLRSFLSEDIGSIPGIALMKIRAPSLLLLLVPHPPYPANDLPLATYYTPPACSACPLPCRRARLCLCPTTTTMKIRTARFVRVDTDPFFLLPMGGALSLFAEEASALPAPRLARDHRAHRRHAAAHTHTSSKARAHGSCVLSRRTTVRTCCTMVDFPYVIETRVVVYHTALGPPPCAPHPAHLACFYFLLQHVLCFPHAKSSTISDGDNDDDDDAPTFSGNEDEPLFSLPKDVLRVLRTGAYLGYNRRGHPLVSHAHPADTLKIATATNAASREPELPATVSTGPKKRDAAPPRAELQRSIGEMTSALGVDHAPANAFLIAALISGACERTGLCRSPEHRGTVCEGLQLPDYAHAPEGVQEILAMHACLALLVGGAAMYQAIGWEIGKLDPALKRITEENVIKDENGKKVLQLAIQQVESELTKALDVPDTLSWHLVV